MPSNRDHKALNRGTLGGVGRRSPPPEAAGPAAWQLLRGESVGKGGTQL